MAVSDMEGEWDGQRKPLSKLTIDVNLRQETRQLKRSRETIPGGGDASSKGSEAGMRRLGLNKTAAGDEVRPAGAS